MFYSMLWCEWHLAAGSESGGCKSKLCIKRGKSAHEIGAPVSSHGEISVNCGDTTFLQNVSLLPHGANAQL